MKSVFDSENLVSSFNFNVYETQKNPALQEKDIQVFYNYARSKFKCKYFVYKWHYNLKKIKILFLNKFRKNANNN